MQVEAALGVVNSVQGPLLGAAVVGDEPARVAAGDVALAVGGLTTPINIVLGDLRQ